MPCGVNKSEKDNIVIKSQQVDPAGFCFTIPSPFSTQHKNPVPKLSTISWFALALSYTDNKKYHSVINLFAC